MGGTLRHMATSAETRSDIVQLPVAIARADDRMADQAVSSGRTQTLEPMSANERRLIHIALRDNDLVETSSVGEEPRRKVTIIPK